MSSECSISPNYYRIIIHCLSFSTIPIYCVTYYALAKYCAQTFQKYRIILSFHISLNLAMEIFSSYFWVPKVHLSWLIVCSLGIASNFPLHGLIFFILLSIAIGHSIISLFEYRMNVLVKGGKSETPRKFLVWIIRLFYIELICLVILTFYTYFVLDKFFNDRVQMGLNDIPMLSFCPNCVYPVFSDFLVKIAFHLSYLTVIIGVFLIIIMSVLSIFALRINHLLYSIRTLKIQKNFLYSLFVQISVHVMFMCSPIIMYFSAYFVEYNHEMLDIFDYLVMISLHHGSISTVALLISNKPLFSFMRTMLKKRTLPPVVDQNYARRSTLF